MGALVAASPSFAYILYLTLVAYIHLSFSLASSMCECQVGLRVVYVTLRAYVSYPH